MKPLRAPVRFAGRFVGRHFRWLIAAYFTILAAEAGVDSRPGIATLNAVLGGNWLREALVEHRRRRSA